MLHHLQHQGLPNGVSGGPQQLDEGPNGMGGPGFCNPQVFFNYLKLFLHH